MNRTIFAFLAAATAFTLSLAAPVTTASRQDTAPLMSMMPTVGVAPAFAADDCGGDGASCESGTYRKDCCDGYSCKGGTCRK